MDLCFQWAERREQLPPSEAFVAPGFALAASSVEQRGSCQLELAVEQQLVVEAVVEWVVGKVNWKLGQMATCSALVIERMGLSIDGLAQALKRKKASG